MREKQRKLLLELRSVLVGKMHTQPYTIYTDETIEDLLNAQPKTMEELGNVKGFPPTGKRIKGFGEAVLKIFNNPEKIVSFSVDGSNEKEAEINVERMNLF